MVCETVNLAGISADGGRARRKVTRDLAYTRNAVDFIREHPKATKKELVAFLAPRVEVGIDRLYKILPSVEMLREKARVSRQVG